MGFIAPYKWLFSARIALTVLNAVMGLVASYGSSLVIRAAQERSVPWLWKGTAVLAASLVVEALSVVSGAILMSRVSFGSLKDIRNQIVSRLMKAPVSFFAASHTGDISSRMTSDVYQRKAYGISVLSGAVFRGHLLYAAHFRKAHRRLLRSDPFFRIFPPFPAGPH